MKNTNWKVPVIIAVGVVAIILLIIFGSQSFQNKAIALEEQVNTALSDIKVQEKRRVDLVYNLVDCVKEYDKHEANTLSEIVDKRASTGDIENVTTAITAVAEAYPELKSNENYKELMNELSMTENLITEYRSNYNKHGRLLLLFPGTKLGISEVGIISFNAFSTKTNPPSFHSNGSVQSTEFPMNPANIHANI